MFCSAEILVEPKKASHHSLRFVSLLVCLLCQLLWKTRCARGDEAKEEAEMEVCKYYVVSNELVYDSSDCLVTVINKSTMVDK